MTRLQQIILIILNITVFLLVFAMVSAATKIETLERKINDANINLAGMSSKIDVLEKSNKELEGEVLLNSTDEKFIMSNLYTLLDQYYKTRGTSYESQTRNNSR